MEVPITLRRWFVAHSVVEVVLGLPLLLCPGLLLHALGWTTVDGASTRLVGAALLAIGAQSYFGRNGDLRSCASLLNLKLVWSYAAILGLLLSIGEGAPSAVWAVLSAFIAFAGVWTHYRIRFKQLAGLATMEDGELPAESDSEAQPD
jgi:hypothetical protein